MKAKYRVAGLVLLAASGNTVAIDTPKPGKLDYRLRSMDYHPDQVYRLRAQIGYATYLQFAPGEMMDFNWTGDSAWDIEGKKNLVSLKPTAEDPTTNIIISTNRGRVYNLDLSVVEEHGYYGVRFAYPLDEQERARLAAEKDALLAAMDPERQTYRNVAYSGAGSAEIQPVQVFDNGRYTFFKFSEPTSWPAIFRVERMADKSQETLVNPTVRGNWLIVPRVGREWRLRHSTNVLCIRNDKFQPTIADNPGETATPATRRIAR